MFEIRPANENDGEFLKEMLFEAVFWDPASVRPPRGTEGSNVLDGWGRRGDHALIAEVAGTPIGAAWYRLWTTDNFSYGFVDDKTPELGIGVLPECRRQGAGRALLQALIATARAHGFPALSLSVSPKNHALQLYKALGFRKVGESGTSWTMVLGLR